MTELQKFFGVECLPVEYGGKITIPQGTGVALANLFQLYGKEFESKDQIAEYQESGASPPYLPLFIHFCSPISVANSFGYNAKTTINAL